MGGKGLWPAADAAVFLPVEMAAAPEVTAEPSGASAEITVVLRNGRQLRCLDGIGEPPSKPRSSRRRSKIRWIV